MKETVPPSQNWLQRFFSRFRPHRAPAAGADDNTAAVPISTNAIASAESALRWISRVPGSETVQIRIGAALEMIKGLNVPSSHDASTHGANPLKHLEYHIRYLTELFEPFAFMDRPQISPLLQSEVLMLGRRVETASLKMKPAATSSKAPKWYSLRMKRREEHGVSAPDIDAFMLDLILALDQFRGNALPLYPISPIEAGLLPLGMVSNSSCALSPFLEWILKSERVTEYRLGAVHTVQVHDRWLLGKTLGDWDYSFMLVGLENGRRIENWLKIELHGPDMQGTVTFGTTMEALSEGLPRRGDRSVRMADYWLPVTGFFLLCQDQCAQHDGRFLHAVGAELKLHYFMMGLDLYNTTGFLG
ncbi:hypothetical protein BS47DRAFT_244766 [Hydnum rufescens UP504]|uniref:Uncharacterized protein n=1 Tax=Hydnum rufescens UP504 TaxID=1448309 RepID=A0A9P6ALX7_9AGAM|nr:hypothetical protein BS47DRAFT_244766 [Hydnum rufescens UP504]